ncbi:MAG TPA: matrixin family metalloprotease, partial [Polyangiaceae bacterium]|nr:matrixin family metalloprotease [Polyangiaceae bacterium]
MSSSRLAGITSWAVALVLLLPASAAAYCRTMTCELGKVPEQLCPTDDGCNRDEHCCATEGVPLHWTSPCLDFSMQLDGSVRLMLDADEMAEIVLAAFERWRTVECPEGGHPRFAVRLAGFVTCDERQTVCAYAPGNQRLVVVRDETWPYAVNELAITTPAAVVTTGEVVDTDLELNAHPAGLNLDGEPGTPGFEALENIITHEVGHFLGLAHSDDPEALMYFAYQSSRDTSDLLSADDIAGICAVFPPGSALDCGANPGPAYDECAQPIAGEGVGDGSMDEDSCI